MLSLSAFLAIQQSKKFASMQILPFLSMYACKLWHVRVFCMCVQTVTVKFSKLPLVGSWYTQTFPQNPENVIKADAQIEVTEWFEKYENAVTDALWPSSHPH